MAAHLQRPGDGQKHPLSEFGIHMVRLILCAAIVLLSGCGGGDPVANDPMLKLNVKRGNSESVGRYRVSHTGVISESGERSPDGAGTSEKVTIDKIADEGVTVTITFTESDTGESSKQFLVPYNQEITVAISQDITATAHLERQE